MTAHAGDIRTADVWVGAPGQNFRNATFTPIAFADVPRELDHLLAAWRSSYLSLSSAEPLAKVHAIAAFHHKFVSIHPFLDGNGRLARFVLSQQARELCGRQEAVVVDDGPSYFHALARADEGRYDELDAYIAQAIFGGDVA
jgi:fido (protein-threonine AMPylation protein)